MPSTPISALVPMLRAANLKETMEFYTQRLGFQVAKELRDDKGEPTWCFLEWDGAQVMFYAPDEDSVDETEMTGSLYFYPDDLDQVWEEIRHHVSVERPPMERSYGMREFAIRDCNGYSLRFGKRVRK